MLMASDVSNSKPASAVRRDRKFVGGMHPVCFTYKRARRRLILKSKDDSACRGVFSVSSKKSTGGGGESQAVKSPTVRISDHLKQEHFRVGAHREGFLSVVVLLPAHCPSH